MWEDTLRGIYVLLSLIYLIMWGWLCISFMEDDLRIRIWRRKMRKGKIFSGDYSRDMWKEINTAKTKGICEGHYIVYVADYKSLNLRWLKRSNPMPKTSITEPEYKSECCEVDTYVERIWEESGWVYVTKCYKCGKPCTVRKEEGDE